MTVRDVVGLAVETKRGLNKFDDDLHRFGLQNIARGLGSVVLLDDPMEKVSASVG